MNCPFCTENIHPGSKFCPKCGLPLKDDSSVTGAYVVDDGGLMNPWLIGAGALGIVVVALGIGWATGQKDRQPQQTVRREPVGSYNSARPSWAQFGNGGGAQPLTMAPAPSAPSFRTGAAMPFTPNIPVRWAWTPPPKGAAPAVPAPVLPPVVKDPEPPRVPLFYVARVENRQPTNVKVVQPEIPEVPAFPYVPRPPQPTMAEAESAGGPEAVAVDPDRPVYGPHYYYEDSAWEWDPVHERWARRPEWRPRRRAAARAGARTPARLAPAPQAPFVDGTQGQTPQPEGDAPTEP